MRVKGWARDGLTDKQIAKKIGIGIRTFYDWQKAFPQFSQTIKDGKAPVDIEVENALLQSALGHTVKIRKPIKVRTKKQLRDKGTIEEERIEYAEEEIYIPPQTAAQIFWLKNRRPDKWRDKPPEIASVSDDGGAVDPLTAAIMAEIERRTQNHDGTE